MCFFFISSEILESAKSAKLVSQITLHCDAKFAGKPRQTCRLTPEYTHTHTARTHIHAYRLPPAHTHTHRRTKVSAMCWCLLFGDLHSAGRFICEIFNLFLTAAVLLGSGVWGKCLQ